MAKKNEGVFTFDQLNKELSNVSEFGDVMTKSVFSKIDHFIHTGSYILNACMTGSLRGGIPNKRTVQLAGPEGVGKTYLLLNICRMAQMLGYYVVFYDSESAIDIDMIEKFGIDPEKFRYEPVNTIEEFRTLITNLTDTLRKQRREGNETPKVFCALDSLGSLASNKEINDALSGSDKADMTRAKVIRSIFRILGTRLAENSIPMVFTNHIYDSTSIFSSGPNAGGGRGPAYFASITTYLYKGNHKEGDKKAGIVVTAMPAKNRFAIPTKVKFIIHFTQGMNPYIGLHEYLSWKNCGIEKGNIISENDYNKLKDSDKAKCGEMEVDGKKCYFLPKSTARNFIIKHLGKGIKFDELFTPEVFTEDVLDQLDENVIKPNFQYKSNDDFTIEVDDLVNEDEYDEETNEQDVTESTEA